MTQPGSFAHHMIMPVIEMRSLAKLICSQAAVLGDRKSLKFSSLRTGFRNTYEIKKKGR